MKTPRTLEFVEYEDEKEIPSEKIITRGVRLKPDWEFSFGTHESENEETGWSLYLWIEAVGLSRDELFDFEFDVPLNYSDIPNGYVVPVAVLVGYEEEKTKAILNTLITMMERMEVVLSDDKKEVYITIYTPRKNFDLILPWETAEKFFELV